MQQVPFTVALAQVVPVFMDRVATLEKACELIVDAGHSGARLIVLPEAFLPGYPIWVWSIPPSEEALLNGMYTELVTQAVGIPSETTDRLCRAAQRGHINVVIGLNERDTEASGAACYNTLLYINAQGQILGKHRSLVLTGAERLVWAKGDGSTLQTFKLPFGTISGLIGDENYLPLARYTLYAWGTQIYLTSSREHGEPWLSTLRHIAKEGRVFVLGCNMVLRSEDIPDSSPCKQFYPYEGQHWISAGGSVIIHPNGALIAGPVQNQETILYAEIDPRQVYGAKWMLDQAGHDGRPDIFQLTVSRESLTVIKEK